MLYNSARKRAIFCPCDSAIVHVIVLQFGRYLVLNWYNDYGGYFVFIIDL